MKKIVYYISFLFGFFLFSLAFAKDPDIQGFTKKGYSGPHDGYYEVNEGEHNVTDFPMVDINACEKPAFLINQDAIFNVIDKKMQLLVEGSKTVTALQIMPDNTFTVKGQDYSNQTLYINSKGKKAIGINALGKLNVSGELIVVAESNAAEKATAINGFENIKTESGKIISAEAKNADVTTAIKINNDCEIENN